MGNNNKVAVIGLGEIGEPLLALLSTQYDVIGVDVTPSQRVEQVGFMHICYPFQIYDFTAETARYIDLFQPEVTVINSTVPIGTTRKIAERTGALVVNSPVRGKHARMLEELRKYTKYIGAMDPFAAERTVMHFQSVGVKTRVLASPESTELAKLTETTYFGLLIAWAQEVERYCDRLGLDYDTIVSFYEEIDYLPPVKFFPGIIGGHCVMPNIEILGQFTESMILDAIRASNRMKTQREASRQAPAIA